MTTDTRTKLASRTLVLGGKEVTISAIAKGSGMIAPQLATMIAVITTDCAIAPALLDQALARGDRAELPLPRRRRRHEHERHRARARERRAGNPRDRGAGRRARCVHRGARPRCAPSSREDIASDGEGATRLLEVVVTRRARPRPSRATSRGRSPARRWSRRRSSAPIRTGAACSPPSARAPARRTRPIDPHRAARRDPGRAGVRARRAGARPMRAALRAKMRAPEVRDRGRARRRRGRRRPPGAATSATTTSSSTPTTRR